MSDQELSAFCDLLLSVRRAKRAFLVAGFELERWDNFAAGLRRRLRDTIIAGDDLSVTLTEMVHAAEDFRRVINVESARAARAIRVANSEIYQVSNRTE